MEIFKINDKQIRCILDQKDLAERKISISDFTHSSIKANTLFSELIQKIAKDYNFLTDDTSLAVEAIPSGNDRLILNISKVDNPEELKKNVSESLNVPVKFTVRENNSSEKKDMPNKTPRRDFPDVLSQAIAGDFFKAASDFIQNLVDEDQDDDANSSNLPHGIDISLRSIKLDDLGSIMGLGIPIPMEPKQKLTNIDKRVAVRPVEETTITDCYSFGTMADLARLASIIGNSFKGKSAVYKDDAEGLYWLKLSMPANQAEKMQQFRGIVCEYGNYLLPGLPYRAFLEEQCIPLIKVNALKKLMLLNMH